MLRFIIATIFLSAFSLLTTAQGYDPKYPSLLVVAADGTGNYTTIQEAINSTRDLGQQRVTIYIRQGTYHEKVIIPSWKTAISLIGDSTAPVIITNADHTGKLIPGCKDASGLTKFTTYTSYTLLVQGNDCMLQNLTIENTSGRQGQAVALHVEGDRFVAKNCRMLGTHDTLYATIETSRQYYENCYVEGVTDFIFGEATCVFQSCTIKALSDSYLTAAATKPGHEFGFVFFDCKLIADTSVHKEYLGRPWRPYAKTVFIRTDMGAHILPAGWDPWKGDKMFPDKEKTTYYAEYGSYGAGGATGNRVSWSHQLTKKELKRYTLENIFANADKWIPVR